MDELDQFFSVDLDLLHIANRHEAVRVLKILVEAYPQYKDAEMLLKDISRQGPSPW